MPFVQPSPNLAFFLSPSSAAPPRLRSQFHSHDSLPSPGRCNSHLTSIATSLPLHYIASTSNARCSPSTRSALPDVWDARVRLQLRGHDTARTARMQQLANSSGSTGAAMGCRAAAMAVVRHMERL